MIVVPYLPMHLRELVASPYQVELATLNLLNHADALATCGEAYSALQDGVPVMCAGIVPAGATRAEVWAIMGAATKGNMLDITRKTREFLDTCNRKFDRIDTVVRSDFELGRKWAQMLGFVYESTMIRFSNGDDYDRYRRLANG